MNRRMSIVLLASTLGASALAACSKNSEEATAPSTTDDAMSAADAVPDAAEARPADSAANKHEPAQARPNGGRSKPGQ